MEEMELICFKIISAVGEAKSDYISALEAAKKGDFANAELITKEAGGERTEVCLLLMHAEDQLMAAETIKLLASELIELYKK